MSKSAKLFLLKTGYYTTIIIVSLLLMGFHSTANIDSSFPSITQPPQKVSLLLPLKGRWQPIAEAIQTAFLTANEKLKQPLVIEVFDTSKSNNIYKIYQKAVQNHTDLVIGPLLKQELEILSKASFLPVPILTLNYLDVKQSVPANFYQFGLSPLDEIKVLIDQAKADHHSTAFILAPNTLWGKKLGKAFADHFARMGGTITGCLYYSDKMPALNQQIKNILGSSLSSASLNIDCIFLAASSEEARQINPLLSFYSPFDLPVYATASVYDASLPSHLNRDLDKLIICDTPWSLKMHHIHSNVSRDCLLKYPEQFAQYARYYALGTDALYVAAQLFQLDQDTQKEMTGASGILSLDHNRYIIREPSCGKFKRSIPYPLIHNASRS